MRFFVIYDCFSVSYFIVFIYLLANSKNGHVVVTHNKDTVTTAKLVAGPVKDTLYHFRITCGHAPSS